MSYTLYKGDCLEEMKKIEDGSVDMILCDLPYGTTACKWDTVIPFEPLWAQYRRIAKRNAAIVLTASQPFTSALIASNFKDFRYCWVWEKTIASNFMHTKRRPGKKHEEIAVFYRNQPTYNPQMVAGKPYADKPRTRTIGLGRDASHTKASLKNYGTRYPGSVIKISNGNNGSTHPTQKPIALMEYMIRTYTQEGETVLDNCAGSGTTGVACANTGRKFIGIERDDKYFDIAKSRIQQAFDGRLI